MTNRTNPIMRLPSIGLAIALSFAFLSPAAAIQNIGFPDDQSMRIVVSDYARFKQARTALHNALATLTKNGADKQSKGRREALQAISSNASVIQSIAKAAGNKDIANFMATVKSWSTSGDADREAELAKKIDASLLGLKVTSK